MSFDDFKKLGLRKGYIKLSKPTDDNVDISLVKKRPFVGERNDYGEKEYPDMKFDRTDLAIIIEVQEKSQFLDLITRKGEKQNPVSGVHSKLWVGIKLVTTTTMSLFNQKQLVLTRKR